MQEEITQKTLALCVEASKTVSYTHLDFSTAVDFRMNYHQIIIEINRFIGILRDKIFCTAADKVSFDFHKGIVVNELNKLVDDIGA